MRIAESRVDPGHGRELFLVETLSNGWRSHHKAGGIGGLVRYTIDALVSDGDMVAVAWTGTLPSSAEMKGLSLYRVSGGLLRSTRHALIGDLPV